MTRPPPGLGQGPSKRGNVGKKKKKGPQIKMTKAMKLKMKANEDKKQEELKRSRT